MSIKKIAEKAGVSVSTVSRILNKPDYRCSVPGLREKVLVHCNGDELCPK